MTADDAPVRRAVGNTPSIMPLRCPVFVQYAEIEEIIVGRFLSEGLSG